jgi:GT2 family glycosyltransferase
MTSREDPAHLKVIAVVVSFNRRELLARTLSGIAAGTTVPDAVVVVDNASTDGAAQMVADLDTPLDIDLVVLPKNVGGAGGFTVGIDRAVQRHGADLVWVMDDDTEPHPGAMEAAVRAWLDYAPAREDRPAAMASRVVWSDGQEHPMNTMRERIGVSAAQRRRAAAVDGMSIRSGSFVSLFMDAREIRRVGLPWADYFIWGDDFEYSTRLTRFRDAVLVPASVVSHHTRKLGTTDVDPGPRFYYEVRNRIWLYTRSRSLAPWEKVLYTGATLRIWARTFAKSGNRRVLLDGLARGVRDSLRPPRSNEAVLQDVYRLDDALCAGAGCPETGPIPFSVLLPVYHADTPERLRRAFESSTSEQTLQPSEVVLVRDGKVGAALEDEIVRLVRGSRIPVRRVDLDRNAGLAAALTAGLERCSYDVVARVDADDVSRPERFERQLPLIADGADVVGSAMTEIGDDESLTLATRTVPTGRAAIERVSRIRNPINHPTVVFRRSAVAAVGGYQPVPKAEDYWLWVRMMRAGADLRNVNEPLVSYRISDGAYERRGGPEAFRAEMDLLRRLHAIGHLTNLEWIRNVLVRGGYRFVPKQLRTLGFRRLVSGPATDR